MLELIQIYWAETLAVMSVVFGTVAAVHAAMTKREVRSALGWVGIIILSPLVGAMIYAVAGINRIRRATLISRRALELDEIWRHLSRYSIGEDEIADRFGRRFGQMLQLGEKVTRHPLSSGNSITMLSTGDETFDAMCEAIEGAERSIILETYIFDRDAVGRRIADCLIAAHQRGVEVRVIVDAVGARYSVPSIIGYLEEGGVPVATFNGQVIMGLRLPYANLRTHRKILVVDGTVGFIGGMNIRAAFTGPNGARDTHFTVTGPVVADILAVAAEDWHFETGEVLLGPAWHVQLDGVVPGTGTAIRAVVSGPDSHIETNHKLLLGAFSVAETSIRIVSPYFLPDTTFIAALNTAARRGVQVDVIVPSQNNLAIVARAMMGQFDQILREGCRVHLSSGSFDHSKLMVIDGQWCFIGSSNLDSRSLRLNFEIDLEVYDRVLAEKIERRIDQSLANAEELTLQDLKSRSLPNRLIDRLFWLGSPYL
ncbi:cardiolipin synthase [Rhizobium rosettiformans]|uniref:cardiolipin synthase n=1 Tax=Rhizobium rosettiformans TaxID=1368430 RepID=UPI002857015E|nr:cardiolipin synthase [Rhizobium rosettiformans]MDR7029909.1 cardiolipin synthase [Rhizobium rosettiformans]MDR7063623.1 cardiolipin synthase [Rhizobium rosettiformans]